MPLTRRKGRIIASSRHLMRATCDLTPQSVNRFDRGSTTNPPSAPPTFLLAQPTLPPLRDSSCSQRL